MKDINDNNPDHVTSLAAHISATQSESAMLLVESLLHGLVAKSILTVAEAIEIVDIAADVKAEIAADGHELRFQGGRRDILASISASLRPDLPQD